jgi:tRNA threonylcarbamoyladenosine biosynthesis protein TsaE
MKEFIFDSPGEECSLLLGRRIGELLRPGDILALWGELAAGKTLLTRGIAGGMGVSPQTRVTSPTFTIINEYSGRLYLYHLDLYRITGPDELETLPWEETLFGNGVAVIEWPERLGRLLPSERWDIKLSITGDETRKMHLAGRGRRNRARMAEWVEALARVSLELPCTGGSSDDLKA